MLERATEKMKMREKEITKRLEGKKQKRNQFATDGTSSRSLVNPVYKTVDVLLSMPR
jgi:hypothetical protein